ncbi:MAG TPA: serine hydrolase domain-containing protein [Thermoanaerobaculia bacterium]|jgi:CubicO group peptidase (beta-lactamase class C family)
MRTLFAFAAVLAIAFCSTAQEAPRVQEAALYLERMVPFGFSGSVLVMHEGKVLLEKGYGMADRVRKIPNTPDTLFDIGSIVKTFTATAIQKYVDSGRVSLDDTLPKFFDGVPEDKRAITVRQLMTHTAGLPLYTGEDYELVPREKMISMAFSEKLRFEPGTRWAYCNSCYSLLATVLEKLSGQDYESYVHEHLLVPAGMTQTGYVIPNFLGRNVARGYRGAVDDGSPLQKAWYGDGPSWSLRGNGGFLSSVRELALWARALDGTKVASAATKARAAEAVIATGRTPDEKMGYGWFVQDTPQGRMVSHSGGNGVFANHLRRYVDRDVVVVVSSNNAQESWSPHERNFVALLFGGTAAIPPAPAGTVPVADLAGRYRLPTGREVELRLQDGQLVVDALSAPEVATLVRPVNALTGARAKELESAAKAALEQMTAGDTSLIQKSLIPDMPAKEEPAFWKQWMADQEKRHGKFVAVTPLWTVPVKDKEDLHTVVLMQFTTGSVLVRWEQRANGILAQAFPPRLFPDQYRFIPQGPDKLVTWNAFLGASGSVTVEKDAIVLGQVRATRVRQ